MKLGSLLNEVTYQENRPAIKVVLEGDAGKEIRIVFKKGQLMKEHKAPHPIVVEIFEGCINFSVNEEEHLMKRGDLITLSADVPHSLLAEEDSIVRLSLSKGDSADRVDKAAKA